MFPERGRDHHHHHADPAPALSVIVLHGTAPAWLRTKIDLLLPVRPDDRPGWKSDHRTKTRIRDPDHPSRCGVPTRHRHSGSSWDSHRLTRQGSPRTDRAAVQNSTG